MSSTVVLPLTRCALCSLDYPATTDNTRCPRCTYCATGKGPAVIVQSLQDNQGFALPQTPAPQQPVVTNQKLMNPPDSATAYNLLFNNMQLFQNGAQHHQYPQVLRPQLPTDITPTLSLHHLQEQQRHLQQQQQQKQKKKRKSKRPHSTAAVESSSADKKFSCQYCDFRSTTSYNVSSHVKSVHSRIKDFGCAHCDFKTSKKWNLKSHVRTVHEKVKDFACSACEYRASRRDALVKHYSDVHQTTPRALEGGVEGGNVNSDVVVDGIFDL